MNAEFAKNAENPVKFILCDLSGLCVPLPPVQFLRIRSTRCAPARPASTIAASCDYWTSSQLSAAAGSITGRGARGQDGGEGPWDRIRGRQRPASPGEDRYRGPGARGGRAGRPSDWRPPGPGCRGRRRARSCRCRACPVTREWDCERHAPGGPPEDRRLRLPLRQQHRRHGRRRGGPRLGGRELAGTASSRPRLQVHVLRRSASR